VNIADLLNQTTKAFEQSLPASPRLDAEVLLARYLGIDRLALFKYPERVLPDEKIDEFHAWIERRLEGEPVAYITGCKEFWSLKLAVNPDVLIPRPDTEILVEEVLKCYADSDKRDISILDVGTGSGAIVIAIATELKNTRLGACDISVKAIAIAKRNAKDHGVSNRIDFFVGDLFTPVSGLFDAIVSNPPYIADSLYANLEPGVKDFEPPGALKGGPDGTEFHRRLIRESKHYLKDGGRLFMEIGLGQSQKVADLFKDETGYDAVAFRKDYSGIERCAMAIRRY
jgi:release factor glutamine methyltransferase